MILFVKLENAKVDVYPWDYSVIPANNFNWQTQASTSKSFELWLILAGSKCRSILAPLKQYRLNFLVWQFCTPKAAKPVFKKP